MRREASKVILIVDDDEDDRLMARDALTAGGTDPEDLRFVCDGEELMNYLQRTGTYAGETSPPRPGLILLDLNMPRKDGRTALKEIKSNPALRDIPIVILSTSEENEDISQSYAVGGNSFVKKPDSYKRLVDKLREISHYWFETVELPELHTR